VREFVNSQVRSAVLRNWEIHWPPRFYELLKRECSTLELICYSGGLKSFWPQIQRSGFDSRRYQIFWEVVCLERGPLSLVSIIEELLERKSSGSGLKKTRLCTTWHTHDKIWLMRKSIVDWNFGNALYHLIKKCCVLFRFLKPQRKNIKLRGLSPRATYTDRATAACRQS
jgi:hypothetical protein